MGIMMATALAYALMTTPSYARTSGLLFEGRKQSAFVIQTQRRHCSNKLLSINKQPIVGVCPSHRQRGDSATHIYMTNNDDGDEEDLNDGSPSLGELFDLRRPDKKLAFIDAMLEIPDPRLLAGDLLFLLNINFLLQIANEVGDPSFWSNGGFSQPITMPTTLLAVIVRDSKMSLSWVIAALWNRSYASSSVLNDKIAVKTALQVWVDYCSLRILLELGESFLFTHSSIDILMLGKEFWYTAIVMGFFRLAYGRFISW